MITLIHKININLYHASFQFFFAKYMYLWILCVRSFVYGSELKTSAWGIISGGYIELYTLRPPASSA